MRDRELEALGLLAAGKPRHHDPDELVIAHNTTNQHLTHVLDMLGAANRTQATARARELGLLRYHSGAGLLPPAGRTCTPPAMPAQKDSTGVGHLRVMTTATPAPTIPAQPVKPDRSRQCQRCRGPPAQNPRSPEGMTTMRPRWRNAFQPRPNRPLRAPTKGAMSSTRARPRPLRSLILLTLLTASLAVGLVPAATASVGSHQAPLAASTTITTWPTLRYGSRGSAVVYLQQRLTWLHYDVGGVDGVFGYSTLHAVYAFQKVQAITVDGVVGPITWSRLASPYRPHARSYRSAAAVEVNLSRRVVYLTRSGAITRILDASPGKSSTPTPTGSFWIYRRIDGWHLSPLGWMWRPNYFYGGYALHGSNSVPTYAASHGCVRVTVPAMNRAWSQLYVGERLYVYR